MELMVHATIEEEIFYPAVKRSVEEEIHNEAYVEHDGAKVLIAEILAGSADDEFYDAKVKVLSEMIKHHVKEEEQKDGLFAQAKKGDVDMHRLVNTRRSQGGTDDRVQAKRHTSTRDTRYEGRKRFGGDSRWIHQL